MKFKERTEDVKKIYSKHFIEAKNEEYAEAKAMEEIWDIAFEKGFNDCLKMIKNEETVSYIKQIKLLNNVLEEKEVRELEETCNLLCIPPFI